MKTQIERLKELNEFKKGVEARERERGEASGYYLVERNESTVTAEAMNEFNIANREPGVDFDPNMPGLEDTFTYYEGYIAGMLEKLAELKAKIRVQFPQEPQQQKDFMTLSEVAKLPRRSNGAVADMIARGQLRAFTISPLTTRRPSWRIPLEAIRELGKVEPPDKTPTRRKKKNVKHWFR